MKLIWPKVQRHHQGPRVWFASLLISFNIVFILKLVSHSGVTWSIALLRYFRNTLVQSVEEEIGTLSQKLRKFYGQGFPQWTLGELVMQMKALMSRAPRYQPNSFGEVLSPPYMLFTF